MPVDGILDSVLYALGALLITAAVRWWRPGLPRRWAAGYGLLVFGLFAMPLATSRVQVGVDMFYQWRPWAGTLDEPLTPQNPLLADVPLQILPFRTLVRERLLAGELPLWANELGTGQPLLGNAHSSPFTPLRLMALPVPPMRALTIVAAWQVLLGLLLAHALALALMRPGGDLSEPGRQRAAAVTAVAFALSAYAVVWLYHPLSMVATFVPGVLLGIVELARGGRRAFPALVACAVCLTVSGHPETVAHTAVVAAGLGLVLFVRGPAVGRWRFVGRSAVAALLAFALAAPVLLPVLETLSESERLSSVRSGGAAGVRPPPVSTDALLPLVQPLAFGSPRDGDWNGPRNLNELCSHYAGLVTLALALAGAAFWRGRILAIVAAGGLALAVALNVGPLFDAFVALPGMAYGAHARLRVFWVLAAALAAGLTTAELARSGRADSTGRGRRLGTAAVIVTVAAASALHPPLHAFADSAPLRAAWWGTALAGAVVVAVVLALVSRRRPAGSPDDRVPALRPALLGLVPAAILLDLVLLGARYHPIVPAEHQIPPPPSVAWLQERMAVAPEPFRVTADGWGLAPNSAALYGLWDPRGNDPMRPARPLRLLGQRLGGGTWRPGHAVLVQRLRRARPTLEMLGVRYVLTRRHKPPGPHMRRVFDGPGARILELDDPLPLFFVPAAARWTGDAAAARLVASELQDFHALAVYTDRGDGPGSDGIGLRPARPQRGKVWIRRVEPNGFELVTRSREGMVVASSVSDAPGWRLRIDGEPAETFPVNWAFVGFRAPAGVHRVELRYAPAGWRWGLALFGIALGVLAGLAARGAGAARRARHLIATAARRPAGSGAP